MAIRKIQGVQHVVSTSIIAVLLLAERRISAAIQAKGIADSLPVFLLKVTVIILVFETLRYAAQSAMGSSGGVKRLILGNDYLEGVWVAKVQGVESLSVLSLRLEDGAYKSEGVRYDLDGFPVLNWRTLSSEYRQRRLRFLYEATYQEEARITESFGMATYNFELGGLRPFATPRRFNGSLYFISDVAETRSFVGRKISDSEVLKELESGEDLAGLLRKLWEKM